MDADSVFYNNSEVANYDIERLAAEHAEHAEQVGREKAEREARLAKIPLEDCHEKYRELPPPKHDVPDDELPFKVITEIAYSEGWYCGIFEIPSNVAYAPPPFHWVHDSLGRQQFVPWIIEAPLNSVEILEALLKPAHPFEIHTARHVQRRCSPDAKKGTRNRRLYDEYIRLQGQLELDREISYILVPRTAVDNIHKITFGTFVPVVLNYISIPWGKGWGCPWALVLYNKPVPGTIHTYENSLKERLGELELSEDERKFRRSLLRHGTIPLPECLIDWFAGRPGKSAALPYFASADELETNRKDAVDEGQRTHHGDSYLLAPCCLPTLDYEAARRQREHHLEVIFRRINGKGKQNGQHGCNKGSVSRTGSQRKNPRIEA
ncbi:hypothetical protein EsDP_00005688 [Epichloe bromicola]|uniref:Uncharacterized protein n=1 Tax=Epichloe bromicola TaxID=79588 RepID=A0ABQ0CVI8_9HYPO